MKYSHAALFLMRGVARSATPGPWIEDDGNIFDGPTNKLLEKYIYDMADGIHPDAQRKDGSGDSQPSRPDPFVASTNESSFDRSETNAQFISMFSPDVVIRLIDMAMQNPEIKGKE